MLNIQEVRFRPQKVSLQAKIGMLKRNFQRNLQVSISSLRNEWIETNSAKNKINISVSKTLIWKLRNDYSDSSKKKQKNKFAYVMTKNHAFCTSRTCIIFAYSFATRELTQPREKTSQICIFDNEKQQFCTLCTCSFHF